MKREEATGGASLSTRRLKAVEDLCAARASGGLVDDQAGAVALGISRPTFWRLVSRGELPPPLKIGRASRWRVTDVDALVARLEFQRGEAAA